MTAAPLQPMTTPRTVHPALIAFPIALYGTTVIALLLHGATGISGLYHVALYANVAGVFAALFALVPGYVDAANSPAFSSTRDTGLRHTAFNGLALVLFVASAAVIWKNGATNQALGDVVPLAFGLFGLASIGAAGWYGKQLATAERTSASVIRVATARAR
jgi:uncharacterized membrane protein